MSVLDAINAQRRKDVDLQKESTSISKLKLSPLYERKCIPLKDSIRSKGPVAIIAEHKRASPSEGDYGCPANLEAVVHGYQNAGVAAMSILTEPQRFGGNLDHLLKARALTDLPLLRKDFIIDEYQIHEAKSAGADAILLIAAGLSLADANRFSSLAHVLGLEVLLELHDTSELKYLEIEPDVVGVNNRNLKTLKIDLKSSIDLFGQLPAELVKISESGIKHVRNAAKLLEHGYQGLLIGTQFMKTDNPGKACEAFIASTAELLLPKNSHR